jgi:alcohol dehydrogenase, propanol-preferring
MKAMILEQVGLMIGNPHPLRLVTLPDPEPASGEVLIRISTCGICHTEIDEIEGRAHPSHLPIILGHQIVGKIAGYGSGTIRFAIGDRVGVAWIFSGCGNCIYCLSGQENLCSQFKGTGKDANGGYAQYMVVNENYAYPIPETLSDSSAAPMLCAGAIGYRSLRLADTSEGKSLGLMGFGSSAHLVLKLVRSILPTTDVYVFSRNPAERVFAIHLGAIWAGDITDKAPRKLDAIIDTTPAWKPVVEALDNLLPAGRLIINAIRKEDSDKDYLENLNYPIHLWQEKVIKTVANVTRQDVIDFLNIAADADITPDVQEYSLADANQALLELKQGGIQGAKVLRIE